MNKKVISHCNCKKHRILLLKHTNNNSKISLTNQKIYDYYLCMCILYNITTIFHILM